MIRSFIPDTGAAWLEQAAKVRERQRLCDHPENRRSLQHDCYADETWEVTVCGECRREVRRIRWRFFR